MTLTAQADRELLHTRGITVHGYRRADGLFDIEAEIADTKGYGFQVGDRGWLQPGERLHHMTLRMTVDAGLTIVACDATTERGPFQACPGGAASFGALVGLTIRAGFLREVNARLGGVAGCTHIRELVQQMATVAFQTTFVLPARQSDDEAGANRLIDSCHAYARDGAVVRRRWPDRYTGADKAPASAV